MALYLIWTIALMVAITYAAVPLYRLYAKVTGYGGTQASAVAPGAILQREVVVRFDSNTSPNLPWSFKPLQLAETIHVGEVELARFRVQNNAKTPITAVATFNLAPFAAGPYFQKLHCFCFSGQTLGPGEAKDFDVAYFIDPKIAADRQLDGVKTLTLSYTFFRRDDLVVDK